MDHSIARSRPAWTQAFSSGNFLKKFITFTHRILFLRFLGYGRGKIWRSIWGNFIKMYGHNFPTCRDMCLSQTYMYFYFANKKMKCECIALIKHTLVIWRPITAVSTPWCTEMFVFYIIRTKFPKNNNPKTKKIIYTRKRILFLQNFIWVITTYASIIL